MAHSCCCGEWLEVTSSQEHVCPRCGTPAGGVWCAGCGLNLKQQRDLPTADAYSAKVREGEWLARQEERHRKAREDVRREELERHRRLREQQVAETAARKSEQDEGFRENPTRKRRGLRWSTALVAIGAVVLVAGVAAAYLLGVFEPAQTTAVESGAKPIEVTVPAETTSPPTDAEPECVTRKERLPVACDRSTAIPRDEAPTGSEPIAPSPDDERDTALERVAKEGYDVADPSTYDSEQTLNAVIGVNTDSVTGRNDLAFFFVNGKYIGTDTQDESAEIKFKGSAGDTVTLAYTLFRQSDPGCCPTGGSQSVRYQWDGEELVPLDPIPPMYSSDADLYRGF